MFLLSKLQGQSVFDNPSTIQTRSTRRGSQPSGRDPIIAPQTRTPAKQAMRPALNAPVRNPKKARAANNATDSRVSAKEKTANCAVATPSARAASGATSGCLIPNRPYRIEVTPSVGISQRIESQTLSRSSGESAESAPCRAGARVTRHLSTAGVPKPRRR